jgi:DNA-binding CsgD family transcriptional regulator
MRVVDEVRLLERRVPLERLAGWLAEATAGQGRLVAVGGEAGAGKSSLVAAFTAAHGRDVEVRLGGCDPVVTPRPLGALQDVFPGGPVGEALAGGRPSAEVFPLVLAELRCGRPTVLVVEDAHWADEATLDLLRFLGRRFSGVPALVIVTYRDDECGPDHPLRIVLGDLAAAPAMRRLQVPRLSATAVGSIATQHGLDGVALYRTTGGNPFFVSEVVAAAPQQIPDTVRDAVLARAYRLPDAARQLVDIVSAVPARAERWLLAGMVGADLPGLDAALAAGMLVDEGDGDGVRFRHELARMAVESALPLGRRTALHRRLLAVLRASETRTDPARLAHHAEAAGDDAAVIEFAGIAARRATAMSAHREAASHYAAVLRRAGGLAPADRAELLELRSYECYLTDDPAAAVEAREEALDCWQRAGDQRRVGDALRWLSRLYWFLARNEDAMAAGLAAVEVLEQEPPGRELAMAYSNMSQLAMLSDDDAGAVDWGNRAVSLGERVGDAEVVIHALNNIGTALANIGDSRGWGMLERSLAGALEHGMGEHVARAYTNMMTNGVRWREYERARRFGDAGIEYCTENDLDSWRLYMIGWRARLELDLDDWAAAAASAAEVLRHRTVSPVTRITALLVLGLVRARRGDPEVGAVLDEALALARQSGEPQRLVPVAAARAEAAWLAGADTPPDELRETLAANVMLPWRAQELAVWAARFGLAGPADFDGTDPDADDEPTDPIARLAALGCRYEAALLAIDGADVDVLRAAADRLRALGAAPALRRASARLRDLGSPGVRGARASTTANPAGLTAREVEVLGLLAAGLPNAAIAARLVLSRRTVDHHVSAVLRKLGAGSRGEAVRTAADLGIAAAET